MAGAIDRVSSHLLASKIMKLDPLKTALLTLDFQQGILGMHPGHEVIIPQAAKAVEFARAKKYRKLMHVGLGFETGHPEVPDDQATFAPMKEKNLFVKGEASGKFHDALFKSGDLIVYKQRIAAFSENDLHMILRANKIENLVFFGVATSGIVLSTIRRAFDLDFKCTILKDACFDRDEEVHRVLTEKVFVRQAKVTTVDAFIAEN